MERRNKLLALSLVVLTVASVVLLWLRQTQNASGLDADVFKFANLDRVDRFVLRSQRDTVAVAYTDGRWLVNERYQADGDMVKVFFATLDQIVPKREVNDSVAAAFAGNEIQVTLFEDGESVGQFVVGGNSVKTETLVRRGDDKSYLAKIPGYRVYVAGIFEAGEGMWRNKRIFDFNWRNFKQLQTIFPGQPADNFNVIFQDNFFGIAGAERVDTTRLNDYLDAVSLLEASEYIEPKAGSMYDSLRKTPPRFSILISDVASRTYQLDVFAPPGGGKLVLGVTGAGEPVLFEPRAIAPLAKRRDYFTPQ